MWIIDLLANLLQSVNSHSLLLFSTGSRFFVVVFMSGEAAVTTSLELCGRLHANNMMSWRDKWAKKQHADQGNIVANVSKNYWLSMCDILKYPYGKLVGS